MGQSISPILTHLFPMHTFGVDKACIGNKWLKLVEEIFV